jgi:hypothetical protein
MSADRRRLTLSVLLSLLFHAVLLSLTFDGQGPGFPGIGFPWQERRAEVPDLRLVILPAQATGIDQADKMPGEPLPQGSGGQPLASGPTLTLAAPRPPSVDRPAEASADAIVPPKKRVARVRPKVESLPVAQAKPANDAEPAQDTKAEPERSSGAIPEKTLERASASEDGAPTPMGAPAAVVAQKPAEPTAGDAAAPLVCNPRHRGSAGCSESDDDGAGISRCRRVGAGAKGYGGAAASRRTGQARSLGEGGAATGRAGRRS